ncbi:MAG TPA: CHASE3 domain-containing protein [Nitrospira sp.]|nr:CHASE3 domain-containing protein [Nitrospira sp.]
MRQRNKVWVYLCTGVLFLLFFGAEQIYILKQWHEVSDTQELRSAITVQVLQLRRLATDIDSGFRGYALMRQSVFLVPVVAAEAEIPRALDRLTALTEKTPSLQGNVQVLKRRLDELIETKRQLTFKIGSGQEQEVLNYVRGGDGVALAKTIANVFDDLDAKIEREFREMDVSQDGYWKQAMWQLVAAQAGAVLVGLLLMKLVSAALAVPRRVET